jgi:hypothetical protein
MLPSREATVLHGEVDVDQAGFPWDAPTVVGIEPGARHRPIYQDSLLVMEAHA